MKVMGKTLEVTEFKGEVFKVHDLEFMRGRKRYHGGSVQEGVLVVYDRDGRIVYEGLCAASCNQNTVTTTFIPIVIQSYYFDNIHSNIALEVIAENYGSIKFIPQEGEKPLRFDKFVAHKQEQRGDYLILAKEYQEGKKEGV